MKIGYLDGVRLKNAIIAGTKVINRMQQHLNKINVFPVPDGDTGTNMASTMNHISDELASCPHKSIEEVSNCMAESALMGAQGNSGVILAQFFNGLAKGLQGRLKVTTDAFADAVINARIAAYEAMTDPREGTILTVIKDWSHKVEELCSKHQDFVDIFQKSLVTAKKSLADTPKKLKVLAKAGVVDAGAEGFVNLLEGITHFIDKGKIAFTEKVHSIEERLIPHIEPQQIEFAYCTECVLRTNMTDKSRLEKILKPMGDSLIVANINDLYRIHIHTNEPDTVFSMLTEVGEIEKKKVDNMAEQHSHLQQKKGIAIITDSTCDLPAEYIKENDIHIISVRLSFGPETFRDKVDISPDEFYVKLLESEHHPTTSQPAVGVYKEVFESVVRNYEYGIAVHLPSVASGTFQTAVQSAKMFGDNKITCIDAKNVSIALGLIVRETVNAVKENLDPEQVIERVKTAAKNTYLYVPLPTLDYLLRGGRVSRQKHLFAKTLNLKPIITFNREGYVATAGKAIGYQSALKKTLKLAINRAGKFKRCSFMVTHTNAPERAQWLVDQLKNKFGEQEIPVLKTSPALGVHAGPGAAGIAVLGYN